MKSPILLMLALIAPLAIAAPAAQRLADLKKAEAALGAHLSFPYQSLEDSERTRLLPVLAQPLTALATQRSIAGDVEGAIAAYDFFDFLRYRAKPPKQADLALLDRAHADDAISAIVKAASTRRVVVLNEAHHLPFNRAFASRLARELRKIGYNYLALEALDIDVEPPRDGQISSKHGYYINEPLFGEFLRVAVADKWKLVAYEFIPAADAPDAMQARELGQAKNIVDAIFNKDKQAKAFIYVGYGHVIKQQGAATDKSLVSMAESLRRMTGIADTLNIDQSVFYRHPDPRAEHPLYRLALNKSASGEPFILTNDDGSHPVFGWPRGGVDMQVIFPAYADADQYGRAAWLTSLAGRAPRQIPPALLPSAGRRLVYAYELGSSEDAVPLDVVLVEAGKAPPALMLPPAAAVRYATED